jgi:uncharacterized protein YfcZ (UPF0381/DUF406 family)
MKKLNYKVVDLDESYNLHIKFIFICIKELQFFEDVLQYSWTVGIPIAI